MRLNMMYFCLLAILFAAYSLLLGEVHAATIENINAEIASLEQAKSQLKERANSLVEKIDSSDNPEQEMNELQNIQAKIQLQNTEIKRLKDIRSSMEEAQRKYAAEQAMKKENKQPSSASPTTEASNSEGSWFSFWKVLFIGIVIIGIGGVLYEKFNSDNTTSTVFHEPEAPTGRSFPRPSPQIQQPTRKPTTTGSPGIKNPRDNGIIPPDLL